MKFIIATIDSIESLASKKVNILTNYVKEQSKFSNNSEYLLTCLLLA